MNGQLSRPAAPAFLPPQGACDSHCHIFGPRERYPSLAVDGYAAPTGELADYLAMAAELGFERRVFVQPVTYGGDNRWILDAVALAGPEVTRAIGGLPETLPDDTVLADWHRHGMRGLRLNYTPHTPYEAGFLGAQLSLIERVAAMVRELGWMIDILAANWLVLEMLPHLARLDVVHTLGHFGRCPARNGVEHPAFQRLLAHHRDNAGCHVKLAAAYQVSTAPGFEDVAPLAQVLYETAPDRVLWGTDWPHMRHEEHGDAGRLLNLFGSWFADREARRRILLDNPGRLFGF